MHTHKEDESFIERKRDLEQSCRALRSAKAGKQAELKQLKKTVDLWNAKYAEKKMAAEE